MFPNTPLLQTLCLTQYDPPVIVLIFAGQVPLTIPKPLYDSVREAAGLPDVLCGE